MRLSARPLACVTAALAGLALSGCVAQRPEDPVVITGAQVPRLAGATPGAVVAFRWMDGRWEQVPVQVDERAQVDLGRVYNAAAIGLTQLTYTDPGTFAGPDPDPRVDADDEIALMGIDSGVRAPAGSRPAGVVAGTGHELRITDPLGDPTAAYVYLFRQAGGLDPAAGRRYVDYRFGLRSGDYKTTYKLQQGPNPEDSTVTTAAYTRHFSDRWVDDGLTVRSGGATGADILDRHKNLFAPGNCARSEDTFSAAEGAFIVNKSGPVRALRAYIGANSGPYTGRQHVFYEKREVITTYLRVHAIGGVMDFLDYSAAATGMTYRNDRNTARRSGRRRARRARPRLAGLGVGRRPAGRPDLRAPLRHRHPGLRDDVLLPGPAHPDGRGRAAVHRRRRRPTAPAVRGSPRRSRTPTREASRRTA